MDRFDAQGKLVIPVSNYQPKADTKNAVQVVDKAYCVNGHSLIDPEHNIQDYPGIRLAFGRPGYAGEFVISAIVDDLTKIILSGTLEPGKRDDLYCPYCQVQLPVLMSCGCTQEGRLVIIGLTPRLDFNNAITFCDVTGCFNSAIVSSGEIIRRAASGQ